MGALAAKLRREALLNRPSLPIGKRRPWGSVKAISKRLELVITEPSFNRLEKVCNLTNSSRSAVIEMLLEFALTNPGIQRAISKRDSDLESLKESLNSD